jgi:nitrite reductase (NADH) large subunit
MGRAIEGIIAVMDEPAGNPAEPLTNLVVPVTLKLPGIDIATFGAPLEEDGLEVSFAEDGRYAKVQFDRETGALRGGVLAGKTGSRTTLEPYVGGPPPTELERLLLPAGSANLSEDLRSSTVDP